MTFKRFNVFIIDSVKNMNRFKERFLTQNFSFKMRTQKCSSYKTSVYIVV